MSLIQVRVGIPKTGGALVKAARERGYPVLFSANAFANAYRPGHERQGSFKAFSMPDPEQFAGLDAALDSAGYVAAVKYGDYRWSVSEYMDLAQAHPWAWYASMDYCLEPQVANDRPLRLLRMAATAQLLGQCNREADLRGMPRPMPVIRGWNASEYEESASWLPLVKWPDLVGVGSVCRRSLHGEHGIFNVVQTLDRVLPPHVKLHLFGVKSSALEAIGGHRRIAAVDSMAWDFGARMKRRVGRDMAFRIECMEEWVEAQTAVAQRIANARAGAPAAQRALFEATYFGARLADNEALLLEALALTYANLLLEEQIEYRDAVMWAQRDAYPLIAITRREGGRISDALLAELDDRFGGIA